MPTDPYSGNAASFPEEIDLPNDNTVKSAASVAVPLAQLADRTMALVPRVWQVGVTPGVTDYGVSHPYVKATEAPGAVLFEFIVVGGGAPGGNVSGGVGGGGGGAGEITRVMLPAALVPASFTATAGTSVTTPGFTGVGSSVDDSADFNIFAAGGNPGQNGGAGGTAAGPGGGAGGDGGAAVGAGGQKTLNGGGRPGDGGTNGPGLGGRGWGAGGGGAGGASDGGGGGGGGYGSGTGAPLAVPGGAAIGGESCPGTIVIIAWCSAHA